MRVRVTGGAVKAWVTAQAPTRGVTRCVELGELSLPAGKYLVSLVGPSGTAIVHLGSVLVRTAPRAGVVTATPVRYQPPRDGTSYMSAEPIHDCAFTVEIEGGEDLTSELEAGPIDVPDYATYSSASYPPTRIDGGISLETLERQCMLLFPTTLLPGCAGIPGMVSYSAAFCRRAVAAVSKQTSDVRAQVRLLAGTLISNGAKWVDERSDDTAPAEMKLCRGDDCDGLSISARALLQSVGRHCGDTPAGRLLRRSHVLLVAGTAQLGGRLQAHMWVAVFPSAGGSAGVINCESTASMAGESHFHLSAYMWSRSACWVLVAADGLIGVAAAAVDKVKKQKLPASAKLRSALSRAYYHVVDPLYSDRPKSCLTCGTVGP